MDELAVLKALTGLENLDETLSAFYLGQAGQFILDYCGISVIPTQLQGVKLQIAAKMIQENTTDGGTKGSIGKATGAVSSLSDGNQSVSYAQSKAEAASFTYDQQSIISAFGLLLNRYRVLKHSFVISSKDKGVRQPSEKSEVGHYTKPIN